MAAHFQLQLPGIPDRDTCWFFRYHWLSPTTGTTFFCFQQVVQGGLGSECFIIEVRSFQYYQHVERDPPNQSVEMYTPPPPTEPPPTEQPPTEQSPTKQ